VRKIIAILIAGMALFAPFVFSPSANANVARTPVAFCQAHFPGSNGVVDNDISVVASYGNGVKRISITSYNATVGRLRILVNHVKSIYGDQWNGNGGYLYKGESTGWAATMAPVGGGYLTYTFMAKDSAGRERSCSVRF
jgi:hypothetical protein